MTQQEEIREGIKKILKRFENTAFYPYSSSILEATSAEIINYLHSQGVVLKVEGELPKGKYERAELVDPSRLVYRLKTGEYYDGLHLDTAKIAYSLAQQDMAGCVFTAPLIKEG